MDELMTLIQNADPATVALNAGIVASVNGASEWITDQIVAFGLKDKLYRFYPAIPFLCAFVIGYMHDQTLMDALKDMIMYGTGAIAAHNLHETAIQGK